MLFTLCLRFGCPHPRHLIRGTWRHGDRCRLTVDDYLDWLAFWEIDPQDGRRDDLRAYAAAITSVAPDARLHPLYPYVESPEDYEPEPDEIAEIIAAQRDADSTPHQPAGVSPRSSDPTEAP